MAPRTLMRKVRKAMVEFLNNLAGDVIRVLAKSTNTAVPETIGVGAVPLRGRLFIACLPKTILIFRSDTTLHFERDVWR